VKGVKRLGFRAGNWLSPAQSSEVLQCAYGEGCAPSETTPCWPCCLVVVFAGRSWSAWS
jgi:hypothetical protein